MDPDIGVLRRYNEKRDSKQDKVRASFQREMDTNGRDSRDLSSISETESEGNGIVKGGRGSEGRSRETERSSEGGRLALGRTEGRGKGEAKQVTGRGRAEQGQNTEVARA
eukprot:2482177-Rhodomonas_salina.1